MLKLDGVVAIVGKLTQNEQLDSGEFPKSDGRVDGGASNTHSSIVFSVSS